MQVQGTIARIRFRNDENGYTVLTLSTEDGDLTCVGSFLRIQEGESWHFQGELNYHAKYGEQLQVEKAEKKEPTTEAQLIHYLESDAVPFIGPKRAKRLVKKYGTDVLDQMLENPKVLRSIPGIGEKKAEAIRNALLEARLSQETMIYLQSLEIGPKTAAAIYRAYGQQTKALLEENPYRLVSDVPGIGFLTSDRIALRIGIAEDSPFRIKAALIYLFESSMNNDGACYLFQEEIDRGLERLLGMIPHGMSDALFDLRIEGKLTFDEENRRWYLAWVQQLENQIARTVYELSHREIPALSVDEEKIQRNLGFELSEAQRDAVLEAAKNPVMILTGGPGTGKTTIVKAILKVFDENGITTELAAPTGRAAKRMEQSTGHAAVTIHRLLGYRGGDDLDARPSRNEENPLECEALIIDEASMLDLLLMGHLCRALPTTCRLIFVGDVDQLPSVGPGNVLRDLIDSELIATKKLNRIYRQSEQSLIVTNAHRIHHGMEPVLNDPNADFFFLGSNTIRDTADLVEELVCSRLPAHYGLDPMEDIRVLSVMKRGECGVEILNRRLQQALNPPSPEKSELEVGQRLLREGDEVMQIRNDYQLEWRQFLPEKMMLSGEGVYNGDFGRIQKIDREEGTLTVDFDGKTVEYLPEKFSELSHSYAITVHKSQGSEFPCIVFPIVPGVPMLLTRNILYTGITRAKKLCVLVGSRQVLQHMVENNQMAARNSSLNEALLRVDHLMHTLFDSNPL